MKKNKIKFQDSSWKYHSFTVMGFKKMCDYVYYAEISQHVLLQAVFFAVILNGVCRVFVVFKWAKVKSFYK